MDNRPVKMNEHTNLLQLEEHIYPLAVSYTHLAGNGLELDAIAACVIGGTSTSGGKGRLWGTFLGALIMGIIANGMNLLNISTNWQLIMQGTIIIVAVGLDRLKSD